MFVDLTEEIGFEWVRPCPSHGKIVMDWRNDPSTLAMSFHPKPKVWASFEQEFYQQYFSLQGLPPLFVLEKGIRVAFLRFRQMNDPSHSERRGCEISIMVAPEHRGKGLGAAALNAVAPLVKSQGYDDIFAEIKVENHASLKIFAEAGYTRIDKGNKTVADTGQTYLVEKYLLRLTPLNSRSAHVFIIAEAGSNWRMGTPERDWTMARALVDAAAEAGADAVKFQTFRPEKVYVANAGSADYLKEAGIEQNIREIFADLTMPPDMVPKLYDYCKKSGIQFMSSCFSADDFATVDPYVSVHKIASYEISHLRLLELTGQSKKPVVLSTGAADEEDIRWAVDTLKANGSTDITLLQCTAQYPAEPSSANLKVIPWLQTRFGTKTGISDHTRQPFLAPVAAVALGATVVEKHYTLHNKLPGPDHSFAITAEELKNLVKQIRITEEMLGSGQKYVQDSEQELRLYSRRGVQAIRPIQKGDLLREGENMDILRPGKQRIGVHPRLIPEIEGHPATRNIPVGSGILQGDWGVKP